MYTDKFFKFPIKIYDGFSARQAEKKEDSMDIPVEPEWYKGIATIPLSELSSHSVHWYQSFSPGDNPDVNGFSTTNIHSSKFGDFTCLWSMDKFEKELNKFMEQWEAKLEV